MKKILVLLTAIVPLLVFSQTPTQNYIHTVTYKTPVQDGNQVSVPESGKTENITYYNGVGQPKQQILKSAGGNSEELIKHFEYDAMGRASKSYLPYAADLASPLNMVTGAKQNINTYYKSKFPQDFPGTENPYREVLFEKTPSGRPVIIGEPGNDWKIDANGNPDHTLKASYDANKASEVYHFDVTFTNGDYLQPNLVYNGYYNANELFVTIVKNENWKTADGKLNTTYSFKDKQGETILNRTYNNVGGVVTPHDQYYVYDDFGNLTYVLSPKASETIFGAAVTYPSFTQTLTVGIGATYEISFNGSTNQIAVTLKKTRRGTPNGIIGALSVALPDTTIGYITNGVYNIRMSIENGNLVMTNLASAEPPITLTQTLTAEIIPGVSGMINFDVVNKLGYQYRYDDQNRVVEKKLPGKGWEYIVYDRANKPILTQDALLRASNKWLFIKYDVFGRTVYTGEYTDNRTRAQIQTAMDNAVTPLVETRSELPFAYAGGNVYYTDSAFPSGGAISVFTINYYDDYGFDLAGITVPTSVYGATIQSGAKLRGLATGSKSRTLGTTNWTTTVTAYDTQYRSVWAGTQNAYLSTTDVLETKLDFTGTVLETKRTHNKTGVTTNLITYDYYTYDQMNRPLQHTQKVGSNAVEVLSYNKYDELGRLIQKKTGGATGLSYATTAGLQTVDYSFNVRGWLTKINDTGNMGTDLFSYEIKYNNPASGGTALYNGNISQVFWKTANTDNGLKNYNYTYDNLNRLKEANYFKTVGATVTSGTYNETLAYDRNGNITSLLRSGIKKDNLSFDANLDNLTYAYDGNVLKNVMDSGNGTEGFIFDQNSESTEDAYTYDNNGNLTKDNNKAITSITYNHINLPVKITFAGFSKTIDFVYNANGTKLSKKITNGGTVTTTQYAGGYVYEQVNANPMALQFFGTSEGYVAVNAGNYTYIYQYKDQVGNVRLSYGKNPGTGTVQIVEENNYYPFGVRHAGSNIGVNPLGNGVANKFKYNGQESETTLGLNVTEMTFRQYDAAIGRFYNIDPLAEQAYGWTPFRFGYNNPVSFRDPLGLKEAYSSQILPVWAQFMMDATPENGAVFWENVLNNYGGGVSGYLFDGTITNFGDWGSNIGPGGGIGHTGNYAGSVGVGGLYYEQGMMGSTMLNAVTLMVNRKGEVMNESEFLANVRRQVEGEVRGKEVRLGVVTPGFSKYMEVLGNTMTVYDGIRNGAVGKFVRNGRAPVFANAFKYGGVAVAGVGMAIEGIQYYNGEITGLEFTVDTFFAGIGIAAALITAPAWATAATVAGVASFVYFGGKAIYEYSTGETLFEKPVPIN